MYQVRARRHAFDVNKNFSREVGPLTPSTVRETSLLEFVPGTPERNSRVSPGTHDVPLKPHQKRAT